MPHLIPTREIKAKERELKQLWTLLQLHIAGRRTFSKIHELQQELRNLYSEAKSIQWRETIQRIGKVKDAKKFWSSVKRMCGGQGRARAEVLKGMDGNLIETEADRTNAFAQRLEATCTISDAENLRFDTEFEKKIHAEWEEHPVRTEETIRLASVPSVGLDGYCTLGQVKQELRWSREKAPGKSGISKRYLMEAGETVLSHLTYLFNCCLATGYFPPSLKHAQVVMIPKVPKPQSVADYRPISLLEVPGKLLERIINLRVAKELEQCDVFSRNQFGFRPKRWTQTAITLGTELIAQARSKKRPVVVILRDVSKAFDKVWHLGLKVKIQRLHRILPDRIRSLLCTFLDGRTAEIRSEQPTPVFNLKAGVPQGAILSPMLYNLYVSDLPAPVRPNSHDIIYADDISQIVVGGWKPEQVQSAVMTEINRVSKFEN